MVGEITIKTPDVTTQIRTPDSTICTITYNANGGSVGAPVTISYMSGDTITLADYKGQKSGYTFGGWSDGTTTRQAGSQYYVQSSVTMTAVWVENE